MLLIISTIIFLSLSSFTLYFADDKLQNKLIIPSVLSGVFVLITLFIIPFI